MQQTGKKYSRNFSNQFLEWIGLKLKLSVTWTIRMLNPVSFASPSLILRQGFGEISNEALKALRCWVVSIVRGLFGPRLPSILVW